ncbi:hypothetical protein, partial [Hymenobacter sp. BT730]|uniref:hypothetical protein n=1 Tax=Hymenobacter sp. BT730 TaxID=3063332 RepID=UPI0026DF6B7B
MASAASHNILTYSSTTFYQEKTNSQAGAAILERFEVGIPGGLTTTQRDRIRQAAESFARDRTKA